MLVLLFATKINTMEKKTETVEKPKISEVLGPRFYKIYFKCRLVARASFLILGLTTIYMIYNYAFGALDSTVGNRYLLAFLATLFSVIGWFMTDATLPSNLTTFFEAIFLADWDRSGKLAKRLVKTIGVWAFTQLIITASITLVSMVIISDIIVKDTDPMILAEYSETEDQQFNQDKETILAELKLSRDTEAKRIEAAKKEGSTLVQGAIDKGHKSWGRGWRNTKSDYNWFRESSLKGSKYKKVRAWRENIYQAEADSAKLVAAQRMKVSENEKMLSSLMSDGAGKRDSMVLTVTGLMAKKIEKDMRMEGNLTKFGIFIDLTCALTALVMVILMTFIRYLGNIPAPELRPEPSFYRIFGAAFTELGSKIKAAIVKKWGLQLIVSTGTYDGLSVQEKIQKAAETKREIEQEKEERRSKTAQKAAGPTWWLKSAINYFKQNQDKRIKDFEESQSDDGDMSRVKKEESQTDASQPKGKTKARQKSAKPTSSTVRDNLPDALPGEKACLHPHCNKSMKHKKRKDANYCTSACQRSHNRILNGK